MLGSGISPAFTTFPSVKADGLIEAPVLKCDPRTLTEAFPSVKADGLIEATFNCRSYIGFNVSFPSVKADGLIEARLAENMHRGGVLGFRR